MTPKEQAEVLIWKMKSVVENSGLHATFDYDCYKLAAIKAAIILCEQIIDVLSKDINPLVNFWFDVKTELENEK
jgi:hypothetical protein